MEGAPRAGTRGAGCPPGARRSRFVGPPRAARPARAVEPGRGPTAPDRPRARAALRPPLRARFWAPMVPCDAEPARVSAFAGRAGSDVRRGGQSRLQCPRARRGVEAGRSPDGRSLVFHEPDPGARLFRRPRGSIPDFRGGSDRNCGRRGRLCPQRSTRAPSAEHPSARARPTGARRAPRPAVPPPLAARSTLDLPVEGGFRAPAAAGAGADRALGSVRENAPVARSRLLAAAARLPRSQVSTCSLVSRAAASQQPLRGLGPHFPERSFGERAGGP